VRKLNCLWNVVANLDDLLLSSTLHDHLGYYTFDECPGEISPTIGMEIGETYTFVQEDRSNYYHALGFSYFPDGAHASLDELEPGITQTDGNTCADTLNCSAPMYFQDDAYLGVYSNIPELVAETTGEDDFGLNAYEPLFFRSPPEWTSFGTFNVKLRFTDDNYDKDIFYFCHVSWSWCFVGVAGWLIRLLTNAIIYPLDYLLFHEHTDPPVHVGSHQALEGGRPGQ
jgi:hypothetical protein